MSASDGFNDPLLFNFDITIKNNPPKLSSIYREYVTEQSGSSKINFNTIS
jgi:hypothetical protein